MKLANKTNPRKTAGTEISAFHSEPAPYVIRYILRRFDVSPSLARTIAGIAMLGGR